MSALLNYFTTSSRVSCNTTLVEPNLSAAFHFSVKTCEFFLCLAVIVCVLYIVSGLFIVLLVVCFTSLVSFTGFYTKDEPRRSVQFL